MESFTSTDTALLSAALAAIVADVETTKRGLAEGKGEENPLLGNKPSNAKVNIAGALSAFATAGAAALMEPEYRPGVLGGITGFRAATAFQNTQDSRFSSYVDAIKKPLIVGIIAGLLSHSLLSQSHDEFVTITPSSITFTKNF